MTTSTQIKKGDWVVIKVEIDESRDMYDAYKILNEREDLQWVVQFKEITKLRDYHPDETSEKEFPALIFSLPAESDPYQECFYCAKDIKSDTDLYEIGDYTMHWECLIKQRMENR